MAHMQKCSICDSFNATCKFSVDHRRIVKCQKCGFVFADSYDTASLEKAYKEDYYKSADDPNIEKWLLLNKPVWAGLTSYVLKYAKAKIRSILDIGSGCGGFLLDFYDKCPNVKLYAIETSQNARDFLSNKNVGITFIDDNIELQHNYKEKFDAITLFQVLEHAKKSIHY